MSEDQKIVRREAFEEVLKYLRYRRDDRAHGYYESEPEHRFITGAIAAIEKMRDAPEAP